MRASLLKAHEGKVRAVDLINGKQITTRITSIDDDKETVTCSKPFEYHLIPDSSDPQKASLLPMPYGPPNSMTPSIQMDTSHVVCVFECSPEHADSYARQTGGIMQAGAGALNQIDRAMADGKLVI